MIDPNKLKATVEEYLSRDAGFFIVRADVLPGDKLIVEIDHDTERIDIDTCVELTKYIEGVFDRDVEDYELEVSSAGLTTPLSSPRQYRKYIDEELEVRLCTGQKYVGVLREVSDTGIVLEIVEMVVPEGGKRKKPTPRRINLPYSDIKQSVYMLRF